MLFIALVYSLMLVSTAKKFADSHKMPGKELPNRRMGPEVPTKSSEYCSQYSIRRGRIEHHCEAMKPNKDDKNNGGNGNQGLAIRSKNSEVSWLWQLFEDYGVELDPSKKIGLFIFFGVVIRGTEVWSKVFQFVKFSTLVTMCFFTSIIWNWAYLYKEAFAEQQKKNMASSEGIIEKCTNIKNIGWTDGLTEWLRSAWTSQDDPCQQYYNDLFASTILQVSPIEAISVTIVMFITEPLKGIGQGIRGFFGALLQDLPFIFQYSVFILVALITVILVYATVQGAFQYGALAPFRRLPQHPAQLQQPPSPQGLPATSTGVATTVPNPQGQGR